MTRRRQRCSRLKIDKRTHHPSSKDAPKASWASGGVGGITGGTIVKSTINLSSRIRNLKPSLERHQKKEHEARKTDLGL